MSFCTSGGARASRRGSPARGRLLRDEPASARRLTGTVHPGPGAGAIAAYRALDADLRAQPFAAKISWDLLPRRRERLHATICGAPAKDIDCAAPSGIAPFEVELRGLFSGNVNVGWRETDLHVVGLWNLIDDLDATEAAALATLIDKWWDCPLLRLRAESLWLLGARDDLVLESDIAGVISLI